MKKSVKITLIVLTLLALIVAAVAIFISPIAKNYIEKHDHELLGRSIRMQELRINIFTGRLRLADLRIGGAEDSTTFVRLDSLDVRLKIWPLLRNRVEVPYITFVGPDVKIYQRGAEFNFDGILAHFASDTTQVEQAPSEPWEIGISNIAIRGGHIFYKDLLLDATWGLNDVNLEIPGVYFSGEKTDVGAVLNFSEGGSLATQVAYDIKTSAFDIGIKLKDLTLSGTLPYWRQALNVSKVTGRLSADMNLHGDVEHLLSLRTDGTASLAEFSLTDQHGRTVASVDTLAMQLAEGDLGKMRFRFDRIYVAGFATEFELTPKGNNFDGLVKPSEPAVASATVTATPSPTPSLYIADFEIARSSVAYRDKTLVRPFEYRVSDIRMRSRDFDPTGRNNLIVEARMQKTGAAKLRWEGSVSDINNQNITLWLTNVALRDFTPFSEHFTAYPITNGNLTFRSQNVIRSRMLDGTNHLDVFEPKVDKKRKDLKPEMKIPLKLGLYVLKDKKGHVKMDLPVKGSLDSPEFSYKKIVLKAIGNVLLKVVTAPFSFLMGHNDNLEYINLEPLQYAFTSEQYASFDKIAGMLKDKPEMHIALTQRLNTTRALSLQATNNLRAAYAQYLQSRDTTGAIGTPAATTAPGSATAGVVPVSSNGAQASKPQLSMIEYEKIAQIDIRRPEVMAFADTLLQQQGIPTHGLSPEQKALALYRDKAAAQLARIMESRDKALAEYMLTTHQIAAPAFKLQLPDSIAMQSYTGRDRYTISLEVEGETVEVTPADSTALSTASPMEVTQTENR